MIDPPIAFQLGPLKVHWYGLMYLVGFAAAWVLGTYRARQSQGVWTKEHVADIIFYSALGVVVGGRVGYMVFYDLPTLLTHPWQLLMIWEGGMSFHGGMIGVAIAVWLYSRHLHRRFWAVTDFIAPLVPLGLFTGRIGNFINGELWGRVTDMPWGIVFPLVGPEPRHPSQLYEAGMEGLLLFVILWWFSKKPRPEGSVTGVFLVGYGFFRTVAELFRQPDPQYGYLALSWITMGMILSLPMIALGSWLLKDYIICLKRKCPE